MPESLCQRSDLGLTGQHVLIVGSSGAAGSEIVRKFLDNSCRVTAFDSRSVNLSGIDAERFARLQLITDKTPDECSIYSEFARAQERFGPANILIVNPDPKVKTSRSPIWDQPLDDWEEDCTATSRATFLAIKYFLRLLQESIQTLGHEVASPAIVIVNAEPGSSPDTCRSHLCDGLLSRVREEILAIHAEGRINAVGFEYSDINDGVITLGEVARSIASMASTRVSGDISGRRIRVEPVKSSQPSMQRADLAMSPRQRIPRSLAKPKRNKIRVAVSIDLDAVSGWLGTNSHPDNNLADYSAGFFAAQVGVPRLLRMLKKLNIANRCTWFIPGHSAESFPDEVKQVVESGCEVGLHGYAHEGAYQLTPEQERDVLLRCIEISKNLTGKKPVGYRAPLYQLRESTLDLLEEFGFEYDASLTDHDCHPFFAPRRPPLKPIDFSKPASTWMHPIQQSPSSLDRRPLVCVPCNYYMEDMTPMQFLPHTENSHGYVDVRVMENLWRDRFLWIRDNEEEPVFPVLMHPDTSGMAHVIGMVERMLGWLKRWEEDGEVEFLQTGEIARWWKEKALAQEAK